MIATLLLLLVQAAPATSPPARGVPGLSAAGQAIVAQALAANQASAAERAARLSAARAAVAAALAADPIDPQVVGRAMAARDALEDAERRRHTAEAVQLLEQLSPADRRGVANFMVGPPPATSAPPPVTLPPPTRR